MHYKVKDGERINYVDFCSLYPWCNTYARYPVSHPEIVTDNFGPISQYFGLAKVKVLPPKGLMFPVLPFKIREKLIFCLCRKCANDQSKKPCECTAEERSLTGTWCTPELMKSIEHGYTIVKIYEIYHWSQTAQLDPLTGEGGLFTDYIKMFLKIKMESSGSPPWVQSDADLDRYIDMYEQHEGVRLDKENIRKNPALRSLAKLFLNSFWGKFGQRLTFPQSSFFHSSEADKFFACFTDRGKIIKDFNVVSEDFVQLTWENDKNNQDENLHANIFIACFTTCAARLKLYSCLERLSDPFFNRVLYMDTDSCFYVSRRGDRDLITGDYLGCLTNELKGTDYINHFVSGGCKQYAYTTIQGNHECKIRGFSLNYKNSKLLNFDSLLDMVTGEETKELIQQQQQKITRQKQFHQIYNRPEEKHYRIVFDKRVLLDNYDSIPFGY